MSDWREQALSAARDAWHGAIVDIPEAVVDAVAPIIRADEREDIVAEITMRCHALRHPNPCPYCDPFINMIGGTNATPA